MSIPVSPQAGSSGSDGRSRSPVRGVVADLLPRRRPSRLLGYTAAFWLASAVLHSVIFAFSGTEWSGAISWRKPIVFSLSIGLLIWTFGWVLDRLPDRPRLAWPMAVTFAASSTAEVALIVMQRWRGRASHFNTFEGSDGLVFALMGALVAVMSLMLVGLLIWSLIERPADSLERVAIIAGLAMIMSGLGTGQWLISLGNTYAERFNEVPETVISGEDGVAKFPHAVAFHGIQVFMFAAVLLRRSAVSAITARRALVTTVLAYFGVLVFSGLQSFGGRAPLDLDIVSGILLVGSLVVLVATLSAIVRWWLTGPVEPIETVDRDADAGGAADVDPTPHRPATTSRSRFEV